MTNPLGSGGYEPASNSAERRAQFDLLRRVAALEEDLRLRGVRAFAVKTTTQASITTETVITDQSVTFEAEAGRRYRLIAEFEVQKTTGSDTWIARLKESSTVLKTATTEPVSTTSFTVVLIYVTTDSITGSKAWDITLERVSGGGTLSYVCSATNPATVTVEDLGSL